VIETGQSAEQLDRRAAVRHGRRLDALTIIPGFAFAAGDVLVNEDLVSAGSAVRVASWVAVLGLVVLAISMVVRSRWTDHYRIGQAVREHADPGPGLRTRADAYARRYALAGWLRWFLPFAAASPLLQGRWGTPALAVPGAVLMTAAVAVAFLRVRRVGAAADRWLDDPPGPPREPEPQSSADRELAIFLIAAAGVLAVLFVLAVVTS
jgi:hypothetical protein